MTRFFAITNTINHTLANILCGTLMSISISSCIPSYTTDTKRVDTNNTILSKIYETNSFVKNNIIFPTLIETYSFLNRINSNPWKNIEEYNEFVRSTVSENYTSDINELYNFYDIKLNLPKYGFSSRKPEFSCFDCQGAVYNLDNDSIYFYSAYSETKFKKYLDIVKDQNQNLKEKLIDKIKYYIKHEAAHAFYYDFGKKLGAKYVPKEFRGNENELETYANNLEYIQYNLVDEGVAEYMTYKGDLTKITKKLTEQDFNKMIEKEDPFNLYELGFILVKPILDKDFKKGVRELIKNPLTKKDLYNLPAYRKKILKKIR